MLTEDFIQTLSTLRDAMLILEDDNALREANGPYYFVAAV